MRGGAAGKIEHFFPLFAATETLIFRELVLRDTNLPFARDEGKFGADRQKFSSDQIIGAVVKEPRAIGFCFYSPNDGPLDNRVRILAIAMDNKAAPVAPTLETIADGSYPLTDTLTIYLRRCAPRPAHEFWKFATGPEGAKIIREHGLWPEYELNKVRGKARLKEFLAGKGPVVRMWGLRGGGGQSGQKGGEALTKALAQVYAQEKALLQLRYEARPTLQEAAQEFLRSGELLLADADPVLLSQADLSPPEGKEPRPEGNEPKTETEPPPASGLKTEDQRQKPEAAVPKAETNETTEPPAQGSGLSPKHSEPGADRRDAKPGCQRVLLGYRAVGVIVHRDSPVTEITLQELQDIYWGRLERWPWADDRAAAAQRPEGRGQTKGTSATGASSGGKIRLYGLPSDSPTMQVLARRMAHPLGSMGEGGLPSKPAEGENSPRPAVGEGQAAGAKAPGKASEAIPVAKGSGGQTTAQKPAPIMRRPDTLGVVRALAGDPAGLGFVDLAAMPTEESSVRLVAILPPSSSSPALEESVNAHPPASNAASTEASEASAKGASKENSGQEGSGQAASVGQRQEETTPSAKLPHLAKRLQPPRPDWLPPGYPLAEPVWLYVHRQASPLAKEFALFLAGGGDFWAAWEKRSGPLPPTEQEQPGRFRTDGSASEELRSALQANGLVPAR